MVSATRTLGPLHFEDLEPKRFEDLCRQLVYDFKTWRRLEATGRAGSDDGFDARGYEIVDADAPSASETDDEEAAVVGIGDRLWLAQCKRERAIGATKLLQYLDEIRLTEGEILHGIIFAAACDFRRLPGIAFATSVLLWACRSGTCGAKLKSRTGCIGRKTMACSSHTSAFH